MAHRLAPLARAGVRIALLESGPHYGHDYFTQREIEMMGLFTLGGAWPVADGSITLAAGRAVGGSTLMYTGVTFRLPSSVFGEWGIDGITQEDLGPRFDRIEEEINVITPGPDMVNDNNRLFKEGCDKLGWPVEKLRLNLKDCQQEGFCNLGCVHGAKQGTMEVQIPQAVEAGVTLVPNFSVTCVEAGKVHGLAAPAPPNTRPGPWKPGEVTVSAKRIVLAAGSPGSPALLLRSGFGREFPSLGRYFTMHPALTVYGIHPETVQGYRGFPKTYYTPVFSESHHHYLETAFYYPFVTTKHLGLWGRDLKEVMRAYNRLMSIIILNHDKASAENRITVNRKGEPVLRYTLSEETKVSLVHAQACAARIFFAAGCERVIMPCADKMVFSSRDMDGRDLEEFISRKNFISIKVPLSSAHPQGGCRMGTSSKDAVCDSRGRVHGHPGLYVADASLFPKSSHVNPYLTIMALADRVAEGILEEIAVD